MIRAAPGGKLKPAMPLAPPAHTDRQTHDVVETLLHEVVLGARIERRLREHELTRQRALLGLALALCVAGIILSICADPLAGGAAIAGGIAVAKIAPSE